MEKIGIKMTNDSFTHQDFFARKHKRNYHNRENFLMKAMSSSKEDISQIKWNKKFVTSENQKMEERGRVFEVSRPIVCC